LSKVSKADIFALRLTALAKRLGLFAALILYLATYNWLYINWLAPTFSYAGFTYNEPSSGMLTVAWVLSLVPALWMPISLERTSQIPYWVVYLLLYIPSMFGPMYMALQPTSSILLLMATLFGGFLLISMSYFLPRLRLVQRLLPRSLFWTSFVTVSCVLYLWLFAVFHSHLQLVGFQDVYNLRSTAVEVQSGTQVAYAAMLLASVMNPLLMAYGLTSKKWGVFTVGAFGQVLIYSTGGDKAVILSILFVLGFALLTHRPAWFGIRIVCSLAGLLVILCLVLATTDNAIVSFAAGLIFMRTVANSGYTTGLYHSFFQGHPLTYLSHLHGVNFFVRYPYTRQIGLELGFYQMQNSELDLNAHFWATDGLAAFGLPGILAISGLCGLTFWVLDSVSAKHSRKLTYLAVSFTTLNLANLSLFTTLISGGLGLLMVMLFAMPADVSEQSSANFDRRRFSGTQNLFP